MSRWTRNINGRGIRERARSHERMQQAFEEAAARVEQQRRTCTHAQTVINESQDVELNGIAIEGGKTEYCANPVCGRFMGFVS